jgi:hypothetical protein
MVAMGVRDESPRLSPGKIDSQVRLGKLQPAIVMKQGKLMSDER